LPLDTARLALGATVVAALIPKGADAVAFALGDGRVVWRHLDAAETAFWTVAAHPGALLCAAADPAGPGVLSGGDDRRLVRSRPGAPPETVHELQRGWVETVLAHPESGQVVISAGKRVAVLQADGTAIAAFDQHPSAVTATALDPKGKRLAAAHYGGVSLWWVRLPDQPVKKLAWKGSHTALTWSPDGRFVMTATQENGLHGWRLADFQDMRMAGYAAKVRALSWSKDGRWLATSGSEAVIVWGFAGKGPMGTQPMQLGGERLRLVTAVACSPREMLLAAGDEDGHLRLHRIGAEGSVDLGRIGEARVTALGWSADGRALAAGCEDGSAALVRLPA
jgi:WD40 repeat protein